jgi:hippurate hydrolase
MTIDIDNSFRDRLTAFRRDLHRHPEIGYKGCRTSQLIADNLSTEGLSYEKSFAGADTAVVAEIRKGEGPVIALPADMDALPIQEDTELPFASVNETLRVLSATTRIR